MINDASLVSEEPLRNSRSKQLFMQIAAWLIDNTSLTFDQIAQCCKLTLEEIQDIADGEIDVEKFDPIISGIVTEKDLKNCQNDLDQVPKIMVKNLGRLRKRAFGVNFGAMCVARRRDKPDAIYYLIKKFPILDNVVIAKLVGTTSHTVEQIRNGTHHNMHNIKPQDPILLGLCSQKNLEAEVEKAEVEREKQERLRNIKNVY
ncbi:MAG: DUF1013 domain-containing protein [Wolbachia endosymbiont of Tyrophagus putrescentiae]|nr:DUF1013 domain-containing protein [Wolbachia endosymbiont of Tyrophagus putrescentiae]